MFILGKVFTMFDGENTVMSRHRESLKFFHAVVFGLLCLASSHYGIAVSVGDIKIDVPWSTVFPILIAMSYGPRYGLVSALSGGALYPFLLWENNGWANVLNFFLLSFFYLSIGSLPHITIAKGKYSLAIRLTAILSVYILVMSFSYLYLFNWFLHFNPAFWQASAVNVMERGILYVFVLKDAVNFILLTVLAETLLRLPPLRKLLGLPVYPNMAANSKIFLSSILFSVFIWVVFTLLEFTLVSNMQMIHREHYQFNLFMLVTSGIAAGRVIIHFVNVRFDIERELRKSEEQYRLSELDLKTAQSVAKIGSWKWDIANGDVVWSDEMYRIFGIDKNSYDGRLGDVIKNAIHPDDLHIVQPENAPKFAAKKNVEYRIILPDASVRTILAIAGDTILDGSGTPVFLMGIAQDITDRKHAEEELRSKLVDLTNEIQLRQRTEQTLMLTRLSVESASDGLFWLTPNGRIVDVNEAACRKLGYTREELLQLSVADVDVRYHDEVWRHHFAELRVLGALKFESEQRAKDGRGIPVEIVANYVRHGDKEFNCAFVRDITERKRSEQLLSQEKERLSVTLRSIGDGVITTDTDGKIVMLNKAAEEMTEWKTEDAAGRLLPEVFVILNEHTREQCENPVEKVLATGSIIELANHTCLISKSGREIQIADSGAPIRDVESRITGVVLVFRDVTEKQKLSDSMQRAQKLESLGILAGGIAHDFNNMLAGIFGYLDLARENAVLNKTEQVPKYLEKAIGVFERAKGLTQQLLTFSKGGAPVRKTIQIAPLIQRCANFALSGSNVTCHFDLADGLWLCDCDENQIGQAIDNIVINGKQAMPMGGSIVITAVNVHDEPGHPGNFVRLSIQDQGIGMPKEILPKIFDPFFSTKTTGHGLGLATVFSIMQRHDGWIEAESTLGRGSTFHLFIPASQTEESASAGAGTSKHLGTGTILVMDDEVFILEIVGAMLQSMGYMVEFAKNAQEALTLFLEAEKSGHPFVASILDLTIPGGTGGKETAAAMRKIRPDSIIIVSSGYSEDPVIANPTRHGFSDSIIKPYRKSGLTDLMMRIQRK